MKKTLLSLLVIVLLGVGMTYAYHYHKTPDLFIAVVQPDGGESYAYGDRFRFIIQTNITDPGSISIDLKSSDGIDIIKHLITYDQSDIDSEGYIKESFKLGIDNGVPNMPTGAYLLSATWTGQGGSSRLTDSSDYQFTVSEK